MKLNKILISIVLSVITLYLLTLISNTIFLVLKSTLKTFIPFIIAFVLAYILQPIVLYFQKYTKKRMYAVMLALILFLMVSFSVVKLTLPYFIKEVKDFFNSYEEVLSKLENVINNYAQKFAFLPNDYQPTFDNLRAIIESYLQKNEYDPLKIISKFVDYIGIIVIIPMTLVYLLIDYEKIICAIRDKLVKNNLIRLKNFLGEVNVFIQAYIKTTFIIMFILMVICSITFMIIGLDYPFFFGLIIAITNVIPYLGPYIGGILPVGYALLQSPNLAILVLIIIIVIQLIESNIISPFLYSKNNEIHPILIIMGLVVFSKLFGILGMIISVPLIGILKIFFKHYKFLKLS